MGHKLSSFSNCVANCLIAGQVLAILDRDGGLIILTHGKDKKQSVTKIVIYVVLDSLLVGRIPK